MTAPDGKKQYADKVNRLVYFFTKKHNMERRDFLASAQPAHFTDPFFNQNFDDFFEELFFKLMPRWKEQGIDRAYGQFSCIECSLSPLRKGRLQHKTPCKKHFIRFSKHLYS